MARKAIVLTKPKQSGNGLFQFDCNCHTTPICIENNSSFQPERLQIGNKVILHERATIERSAKANLFWIRPVSPIECPNSESSGDFCREVEWGFCLLAQQTA